MKTTQVQLNVPLALIEERALRRIRRAIGVLTDAEALRVMIRTAHGDVCPDPDLDAELTEVAAHRRERSPNGIRRPTRRGVHRPCPERCCAIDRCGKAFTVYSDNPSQKYCSRKCSYVGARGRSRF